MCEYMPSCRGYTGKSVPGEAGPVPDEEVQDAGPRRRGLSENGPPPGHKDPGRACAAQSDRQAMKPFAEGQRFHCRVVMWCHRWHHANIRAAFGPGPMSVPSLLPRPGEDERPDNPPVFKPP